MKRIIFITGFIFLGQLSVHSQNKKNVVGAWYGKIRTYQFKQDGNAQCYTKRKIAGWQQQLTIDKKMNYAYTEFYRGDTIRANGHVDLSSDTLKFVVTRTNQPKSQSVFESSYFLYLLNDSELIYSNFPIRKVIENYTESIIFKPVIVRATYSLGNDEFLKILYTSLAKQDLGNKDSVRINSYTVKIDSLGNMDVATLGSSMYADTGYFSAIKQGLLKLQSKFKPTMQNGRPVTAFMSFKITY